MNHQTISLSPSPIGLWISATLSNWYFASTLCMSCPWRQLAWKLFGPFKFLFCVVDFNIYLFEILSFESWLWSFSYPFWQSFSMSRLVKQLLSIELLIDVIHILVLLLVASTMLLFCIQVFLLNTYIFEWFSINNRRRFGNFY